MSNMSTSRPQSGVLTVSRRASSQEFYAKGPTPTGSASSKNLSMITTKVQYSAQQTPSQSRASSTGRIRGNRRLVPAGFGGYKSKSARSSPGVSPINSSATAKSFQ